MNTPRDPFSDSFDAIEIDPTRTPSADAFDRALAFVAPQDNDGLLVTSAAAPDRETPGFYLLDDAQGRFAVDRDTGVVSLRDDNILATEFGDVRTARLRVIETTGYAYTLDLSLRLTGPVPQMAGSEDLLAPFMAPPAPFPFEDEEMEEEAFATRPLLYMPWIAFNASRGHAKPVLGSEHAPFGTLIEGFVPNFDVGFAGLTVIEHIPAPQSRTAIWSI